MYNAWKKCASHSKYGLNDKLNRNYIFGECLFPKMDHVIFGIDTIRQNFARNNMFCPSEQRQQQGTS